MKVLTKRWQKLLYGIGGMGINMLNLMFSSYLCSALLVGGFGEKAIPYQTFAQKDLVIAGVWAVFAMFAKVLDGIIDIPMASFADNLKSKWGRRRPAILLGMVVTVAAYLLFLVVPDPSGVSLLNTIYYGVVLCVFFAFYTLTMVTYYATFTEIVDNEEDRGFISNVKSVCDIVYFILGYVAVSALLNGLNIRVVSLIVLPLALTMVIPLFLIKEDPTNNREAEKKQVSMVKSLVYTFKNRDFMIWMIVYAFMTFAVQLFLGGINEYFSYTGLSMIFVMMAAFGPVPFTLLIYNALIRKRGFRFAFQYVLLLFAAGMLWLFGLSFLPAGALRTWLAVIGGLITSLSVGALFAVAYSIPAQLAADDEARTGLSHSAMYFAVQGLFSGVASGIGGALVLTALKTGTAFGGSAIVLMTLISALGCVAAFFLTYLLPQSIVTLGKKEK